MFRLTIPRDIARALVLFAAKQDIRYYLNGVYVEKHANTARLVTTDGHRLCVASVTPAEGDTGHGSAIIPREFFDAVKRGKHGFALVLEVQESGGATGAHDGNPFVLRDFDARDSMGKTIEGRFPDWSKVTPAKVSGEPAHFNPDYLADFKKAAEILGDKSGCFPFGYNGGSAAIAQLRSDVIGVLMPMRGDTLAESPDWIREDCAAAGRVPDVDKAREMAEKENAGELATEDPAPAETVAIAA